MYSWLTSISQEKGLSTFSDMLYEYLGSALICYRHHRKAEKKVLSCFRLSNVNAWGVPLRSDIHNSDLEYSVLSYFGLLLP